MVADVFRHPDLRSWVRSNWSELVRAVLILAKAWIVAGRPGAGGASPSRSFESWSKVIGGILHHAGIPGFLGNLEESYEESTQEERGIKACECLVESCECREVGVNELYPL